MKKLCLIILLLVLISSVFAEGGPFDFLYQHHSAYSTVYGVQELTGKTLDDVLLESGFIKNNTLDYIYEYQPGKIQIICHVINGLVETTIKCTISDMSEQTSLFNFVIQNFIQVLGQNPVETIPGTAYGWKNTPYGDISVMKYNRYVLFSMADNKKD